MFSNTIDLTDKLGALCLVLGHQPDFRHDFGRWLLKNWDAFQFFCAVADAEWFLDEDMRQGARDITRDLRVDNNRTAGLARLYLLLRPERTEQFQTRRRR